MRDAGIASLRQDRVVVFHHAARRDLVRHEALQIAERERTSVVNELTFADRRVAQNFANAVNNLLGALANGTDGLDFPRLFAFARELDEIVTATPDAPAARSQSF